MERDLALYDSPRLGHDAQDRASGDAFAAAAFAYHAQRLPALNGEINAVDRPDRAYRSVHITGTNGKTSVSRMTAALIQASGLKVGLYTSPHLGHFRERISVNGQPLRDQELVDACNQLKPLMDEAGISMSPFEFLTVAAFFAFRAANVDYAVVEVGIGGRADATNVIAPEVSVITNATGRLLRHAPTPRLISRRAPAILATPAGAVEESEGAILRRWRRMLRPGLGAASDWQRTPTHRLEASVTEFVNWLYRVGVYGFALAGVTGGLIWLSRPDADG